MVSLGGLAVFVLLAATYDGRLGGVDQNVARWVAGELPLGVEWAARPLSWLGGWIGLTILGLVLTVVLVRERAWLDLGFFLSAYVGSQLAVMLVKEGFDRPRPEFDSAVPLPDSPSFPSGHAVAGAAGFGALAVLAVERLPSRRARTSIWVVTAVLGIAVGLSRIALNVHFASDVVAGWCLGLAWLAGCLIVRNGVQAQELVSE